MIKRVMIWSATWLIIVGAIAWATAVVTGNTVPTFVSQRTITYGNITHTLYVLDVKNYLQQIEQTASFPIGKLFFDPPKLYTPDWSKVAEITFMPKLIFNIIIWYINFMMWWFNIILFVPLKLALLPLELLITLLGVNINVWGIPKVINIIVSFHLDYIKYW